MSQADITRLVVGEPFTLGMGRAVGQSLRSSDVSKSLQWRDGKWQGQKSLLAVLSKKKQPKYLVLPSGASSRLRLKAWVIAGFVGLAGTGVALGLLLQSREAPLASNAQPAEAQALPLVQALENVRIVDQPFPAAPAESLQVIQTAEGVAPTAGTLSLPILSPGGVGTTTASAGASLPFVAPAPMPTPIGPAPELTSERSSTRAEARPSAKPTKEEPKPLAVILDEMDEKPKPTPGVKSESTAKTSQPVKPAAVPSAAAAPATVPPAPAATALTPARGLIAITPDGKSAVFTDPATRLPKQFKVGDKLNSGDTIKSIDAAQGKVIAGTKEYSLD
jgi:hypothetical protein